MSVSEFAAIAHKGDFLMPQAGGSPFHSSERTYAKVGVIVRISSGCVCLLWLRLVRRLPTRFALFYLERGSTDHLDRSTKKSRACAIAPDLLEQDFFLEMKDTSLKPRTTWDGGKMI
jgi:hypothetical protein